MSEVPEVDQCKLSLSFLLHPEIVSVLQNNILENVDQFCFLEMFVCFISGQEWFLRAKSDDEES